MAYPVLPIDPRESRRIVRDGRVEDVIGDGMTRVRKMHATRYDFDIKHPMLTSSEMTTFTNYYAIWENATTFDLVWPEDGATYAVRFGAPAFRTQWASPTRRHLWVRLVSAG